MSSRQDIDASRSDYDPDTSFVIPPLEYDVHQLWALARGLAHLKRKATPQEVEAVRLEAVEAANIILSEFEVKQ